MKAFTPSIAWHNRERVSSADFQPVPYPKGEARLATGGDDKHVLIWELLPDKTGKLEPQCICDMSRHQNSVNIVRWSMNGQILASGDTDSAIILWRFSDKESAPDLFGEEPEANADDDAPIRRENWVIWRTLRGHLQDVVDLCWSPCSVFLLSCSTDNTAIVFDTQKDKKVKILSEHKGWVNGVAWDPKDQYLATIASDRCLRLYKTKNFKIAFKTYKAMLPVGSQNSERDEEKENIEEEKSVRLFHDDTFQSFYRRLSFSPDGELLAVPSGVLEIDGETQVENCTYIFSKHNLNKPSLYLPNKEISVVVKFSPVKYALRPVPRQGLVLDASMNPWEKFETLFCLPYRMIYAVATQSAVILYDTQQAHPFAKISKIHYVGLNDLGWSPDGNTLIVTSTDGYCTVLSFAEGELGEVYTDHSSAVQTSDSTNSTDVPMTETDEPKPQIILSKEGIPLNEEGVASPARVHIRSAQEGGKSNPKRLQFITLSSPKSKTNVKVENLENGKPEGDFQLFLAKDDDTNSKVVVASTKSPAPSSEKSPPPSTKSSLINGEGASKSETAVAKVGRRVNLITLTSASESSKS